MTEEEQRLMCLALAVFQNKDHLSGEQHTNKVLADAKKMWKFIVSGATE